MYQMRLLWQPETVYLTPFHGNFGRLCKKVNFEEKLLCGPLRVSASFALKLDLNAESTEDRRVRRESAAEKAK